MLRNAFLLIALSISLQLYSQKSWFPTRKEIKSLDSIVGFCFEQSYCFNINNDYSIWHIFKYELIDDTVPITKSDFVNKTIFSKAQKAYLSKYHLYRLINSNCSENIEIHDINNSRFGNIKNIDIPSSTLNVDISLIEDTTNGVLAIWNSLDGEILCINSKQQQDYQFEKELVNFLRANRYSFIFHLANTAGSNYVAIGHDNKISILTPSKSDSNPIRIISVDELVNEYWNYYANSRK